MRLRQYDGIGDEVAGEDPCALVVAGSKTSGDMGRETFAMAVSSSSMNVARVTVIAISQGLMAFVC